MVRMVHDMIHDSIKVYVGNSLAKFISKDGHILDLRKKFQQMREYKLKLKPQKCAFGFSLSKLLGCIMSWRGIEVDPKKL